MPSLAEEDARRRFAEARVAHLATVRADGRPHLVPIVFAVEGDRIYSIADPKPKEGPDLLRHRNIAANPAVSVLVDAYHEPWEGIWWVRADGLAQVVSSGPERDTTLRLLLARYPDYATWDDPFGDATIIEVTRWSSWTM
jgi:PPOX class probable F420-dependent enzyme